MPCYSNIIDSIQSVERTRTKNKKKQKQEKKKKKNEKREAHWGEKGVSGTEENICNA